MLNGHIIEEVATGVRAPSNFQRDRFLICFVIHICAVLLLFSVASTSSEKGAMPFDFRFARSLDPVIANFRFSCEAQHLHRGATKYLIDPRMD